LERNKEIYYGKLFIENLGFLFVYRLSVNLLQQFAYARGSKYKPFQNHKTAGTYKEPDFIGGRR